MMMIVMGAWLIVNGFRWVRRMDLDENAAARRRMHLGPMENQEGAQLAVTVGFVLSGTVLVLSGLWLLVS